MDSIWTEYNNKIQKMFEFTNGKKVVIWGYKRSGWFIEHIYRKAHKQIEYVIDDGTGIMPKVSIYRSFILKNMDKDIHAVLLSFAYDETAVEFLDRCGYKEGIHYIFVKKLFYEDEIWRKLSYYDWLEYMYHIDISAPRKGELIRLAHDDCHHYSTGIDYALMDVLDNFHFTQNDSVFDFGCGKGGALLLFQKAGVGKLGGVEFDEDLYAISKLNFQRLNLNDVTLYNADASLLTNELDNYNYFFMYNPFQGDTFKTVIRNMEESYYRCKRKIIFIYSGPYCHDLVVENCIFKLSKEIYTDYSVRYVYIYIVDGEVNKEED